MRIDVSDRTVALGGRVVWCAVAGSVRLGDHQVAPDFLAGFEFDQPFSRLHSELLAMAADGLLLELRQPLRGRAVLSAAGKDVPAVMVREIGVIRVGRTGMQLVTDYAPATDSRVHLRLALEGEILETAGRVVAVADFFGGGKLCEIDVELTELEAGQSAALARLIERELTAPASRG